jgi:exopolysaccharide/PEP-CTERM locus tyrosine autokinase
VTLDLEAMAASGLLVPNQSRSLLANEFRVIKRPLIANAMGKGSNPIQNGNLIMVTSALPGEGKSFTAVNLAISIAMELDNTVMLVDADVARPSVLTMLGLPPAEGLLDVVKDDSLDISQVLLHTNVEKLSILPSGTSHPRATELLASESMIRLLDDISKRYPDRIIVFDSPPLLLTTEARALATHMGQIVIVVQSGTTTQAAVREAISTIESCPLKMMVLNQATQSASDRYGYGYAYGYGYGNEK